MALITTIIPLQSFELVRNQLGAILIDEIHNQSVLNGNNADIDAKVWLERIVPFDKTEMPAVNIMLSNGTYDEFNIKQDDGTYIINIDVYTSGKSTAANDGDKLAMLKLQRLIGIIRAIIQDPKYYTLGFNLPFVMKRKIESIQISEPTLQDDALHSVMGRLSLSVKVPETTFIPGAPLIAGNETKVKLYLTDKGYQYQLGAGSEGFDYFFDFNLPQ